MVIYLFQEKSVEDGIKDGKRHKSDENVGKLYTCIILCQLTIRIEPLSAN